VGLLQTEGTQRFYQENHLATELGQQIQRTIFRHQAQPLAQSQSEAGVTETTLLATDQAHSLLKTVSRASLQQFAYTAYGHHPAESGLNRLLGFNGECFDDVTGCYPLGQGNRFYSPVLMRFISPDELSPFAEGGFNSYAYCGNDSINFSDPTGNVKFRQLIKRYFESLPSANVKLNRGSKKIKHQALTAERSPDVIKSSPILVELLGKASKNLPDPSHSILTRGQALELPVTPNNLKVAKPAARSSLWRRKLLDSSDDFNKRFPNDPDHYMRPTKEQQENLSTVEKELSQSEITQKKRNVLLEKRRLMIYRIKRDTLNKLNKTSTSIRR
jgi:RHS repeat-associated protein